MNTDRAIARLVATERARQDAKWGEQNHPDGTGPDTTPLSSLFIGGREVDGTIVPRRLEETPASILADAFRLRTDTHAQGVGTPLTWTDILLEEVLEALAEGDPEALAVELVQASAVLQQWVGAIFRRDPELASRLTGAARRQFTGAHLRIVYLLAESGGATHTRLSRVWAAKASRKEHPWPWLSDSGIRTRTSELVAWGLVEDTGGKGESRFGRPSAIWTLVGVDPVALGRVVDEVPGVAEDLRDVMEALLVEADTDSVTRSHLELAYAVARRRAAIAA
jgi:hypothetical protein